MRTIIIGGVAGGMSAATRLRRLDENEEIIVFEKGNEVSFANCGLPYFIGDVIKDRDDLLLQTPTSLNDRYNLDVRVNHEVIKITPNDSSVLVKNTKTNIEESFEYDNLILSMGASPFIPPIDGIENAFPLRDMYDVDRLVVATEQAVINNESAVVIGAGFIGVEVAENLKKRGLKVTIVELSPQVLPPLDIEMASYVAEDIIKNGVELRLNTSVEKITNKTVTLSTGEIIEAGMVVASIGVRPETKLASEAGLEIGERGGVVIDEFLKTSRANIYAIGDMVEKHDIQTGNSVLIPLANLANKQGRRAADIIVGRKPSSSAQALGTAIVKVFDLAIATTGASERLLKSQDRNFKAIHTHPLDHAGYYPGAETMHLKTLFDPETGELLGAQGIGSSSVAKKIDVIATAIFGNIKANELIDLELAYAPPYGSAKDPINMIGYISENILQGENTISPDQIPSECTLVDVRTKEEYYEGTIPGAINIPLDELRSRINEFPKKNVVVFCQMGQRGHNAISILKQLKIESSNLDGGYETWMSFEKAKNI